MTKTAPKSIRVLSLTLLALILTLLIAACSATPPPTNDDRNPPPGDETPTNPDDDNTEEPDEDDEDTTTPEGVITGVLTDSAGNVIANVTINITDTNHDLIEETLSDTNGRFALNVTNPGDYYLTVQDTNEGAFARIHVTRNSAGDLHANQQHIQTAPYGSVTFTVLNPLNQPAAGAIVRLHETNQAARTNNNGQATIHHVPPGEYTSHAFYQHQETTDTPVHINSGETTMAAPLQLTGTPPVINSINTMAFQSNHYHWAYRIEITGQNFGYEQSDTQIRLSVDGDPFQTLTLDDDYTVHSWSDTRIILTQQHIDQDGTTKPWQYRVVTQDGISNTSDTVHLTPSLTYLNNNEAPHDLPDHYLVMDPATNGVLIDLEFTTTNVTRLHNAQVHISSSQGTIEQGNEGPWDEYGWIHHTTEPSNGLYTATYRFVAWPGADAAAQEHFLITVTADDETISTYHCSLIDYYPPHPSLEFNWYYWLCGETIGSEYMPN